MSAWQRLTLGQFLRAKRMQTPPATAGWTTTMPRRRRVTGLRREEVAQLVGISTAWYTLLEQDRADSLPSRDVLHRLMHVFGLSPLEQLHLFHLAGRGLPLAPQAPEVSDAVRRLLQQHDPNPAYVLGPSWDVLAWNQGTNAIFVDLAAVAPADRNAVYQVFVNHALRERMPGWEQRAQLMLRRVRASYAQCPDAPGFTALITRLRRHSPEFTSWWDAPDVAVCWDGPNVFIHPQGGELHLEQTGYGIDGYAALRLVLYTPLDVETTHRLRQTVAHTAASVN